MTEVSQRVIQSHFLLVQLDRALEFKRRVRQTNGGSKKTVIAGTGVKLPRDGPHFAMVGYRPAFMNARRDAGQAFIHADQR